MPKLNSIEKKVITLDTRSCSMPVVERIRGHALVKIRERIMLRDLYTCQICHRVTLYGEVDHKIPLHMGGTESDDNRQYLCVGCHEKKSEQEEKERGS
jgi:5-methylcytosine-specific restriction endonuclease McrA